MVTKPPMFRLRPETEIANVFFSASPNLIAIVRVPSVSVSSSVAPVVFTRRSARPPAETGPTAALSVPDAWPAMPFAVTRNAPSPSESVTPATLALTLTAGDPRLAVALVEQEVAGQRVAAEGELRADRLDRHRRAGRQVEQRGGRGVDRDRDRAAAEDDAREREGGVRDGQPAGDAGLGEHEHAGRVRDVHERAELEQRGSRSVLVTVTLTCVGGGSIVKSR